MASQLECKNELKVSEDEKTLDKFRDFVFKMNAKPDSETKIFSKAIRVTLEDIEILRTRIIEKLRMHCPNEDACITRITINFSNHTSFDYDTWAKFKQENFERSDYVESITIKWDFQVSMPMYELPQHHSLVVKISSGLTFPEFMSLMVSGKIEDVNDISIMDNVVVARVEFINTLLGDELLNVVSNWVSNCELSNYDSNKLLLFARKYRKYFSLFIEYLSRTVSILITFSVLALYLYNIEFNLVRDNVNVLLAQLFLMCGVAFSVLYILQKLSHKCAGFIYDKLSQYGQGYIFEITSGDKKRKRTTAKNDKRTAVKVIFNFLAAVIFNVFCSIVCNVIIKCIF